MDQREIQQRSPFKMHTYFSTCPFLYSLDFLLFVINPQDQPHIEFILTKDILLAIMQSLVQWKSNTATTNHNKSNLPSFEIDDERRVTCLHCFRIFLLIMPSIVLLSKLPFNVETSLAIHSLVLSRTNKTSYPCSQVFLKQ